MSSIKAASMRWTIELRACVLSSMTASRHCSLTSDIYNFILKGNFGYLHLFLYT